MSQKKTSGSIPSLFEKENYLILLAGIVVMVIGLFLMKGGKSAPDNFNASEVYSSTRVTIAPIVILIGLGIEIYGIMRKPKK